ncbi:L,D-transpeptidase family protein [Altererythrobacter sp. C41]|uniref:L,D-transpeptidase family protein n=1 Tax=Altererythrobacter sp. C41 TaxID=2806021 RepID=UPI001EE4D88A|nr:L,D-transpeptidase family protein [Altererythrobacter sp. C41]
MTFRQFVRGFTPAALLSVAMVAFGSAPAHAAAPAAQPALSQGALLADAIADAAGGKIKKFYRARDYRPLWIENGLIGRDAQVLLRYLDDADLDGLKAARYDPHELREDIARADAGDMEELAAAEVALSKALVRYIHDMRETRDVGMTFVGDGLKPPELDDDAILKVAARKDFSSYLAGMAWMSPHYLRMRELLRTAHASGSSGRIIDTLRINLERARVLPSADVRHIVVDAASARLWYYQNGREVGSMRVVVGAPETQTPMLAGYINYAILNPYWNVPDYLARDNVARKVLAGRSLKSMHMEVLSDWGPDAQVVDPETVDWHAVAGGYQLLRVRELPGPWNSMGKVKFLFPNDEGIYLHDTPARDLLRRNDRHLSNGCIRLEKADELGRWMLGKRLKADGDEPEQPVPLAAPVPVYLTYLTATSAKNGLALLDDVYGRDT